MARLGLTHIRGSTVLSGTGVSGVSGGERRRVGIGMELVIDPQVRKRGCEAANVACNSCSLLHHLLLSLPGCHLGFITIVVCAHYSC